MNMKRGLLQSVLAAALLVAQHGALAHQIRHVQDNLPGQLQHDGKQTSLGGKTEQCTKCHQAVRGPHVFEHPPVVEDCSNCHNPHGSPNRRLLEIAQPMQCLQCHALPGNRHGQTGARNNTQTISGAVLRNCTSCHGAIHGSSVDQHLRH